VTREIANPREERLELAGNREQPKGIRCIGFYIEVSKDGGFLPLCRSASAICIDSSEKVEGELTVLTNEFQVLGPVFMDRFSVADSLNNQKKNFFLFGGAVCMGLENRH